MRALISLSSLLSAAICRLTFSLVGADAAASPCWLAAAPQVDSRGFYQCPAACSCGGRYQRRPDRRPPMPGWCRPPMPPARSPAFPLSFQSVVSSRWFFQPPFPSGMRWPRSSRSYDLAALRAPLRHFLSAGRTVSMNMGMGVAGPLCHGCAKSAHIPVSTKLSFT